jgi:hypothetical protein
MMQPRASMFGGSWINDDDAGSRYANVAYNWPDNSNDNLGARGRSDDLMLITVRRRLRPRRRITARVLLAAFAPKSAKAGGQPAGPASANTLHGPAERGVAVARGVCGLSIPAAGFFGRWRGPVPEGEPLECDGSAWDRLPPAAISRRRAA